MKKIVPFNNVLTFNTDVREITAISLEHNIKTEEDSISGVFYISGEYKITDGQLEKEKFNFDLPFDIALGSNYNLNTLVVDIDDFRYELIDRNKLKVNIDLYIDGEIEELKEEPIKELVENNEESLFTEKELKILEKNIESENVATENDYLSDRIEESKEETTVFEKDENKSNEISKEQLISEPVLTKIQERLDLLDEMLANNKKEIEKEKKEEQEENVLIQNTNVNENKNETSNNVNVFNGFNEDEQYVTYRVYTTLETDTIDKILEKYNISKEELAKYNSIEDIHPGDKLIIPSSDR